MRRALALLAFSGLLPLLAQTRVITPIASDDGSTITIKGRSLAIGTTVLIAQPLGAGADDCAVINSALATRNSVKLGAGTYTCKSTITNLKTGQMLAGSGVNATRIWMGADVPMISISEPGGLAGSAGTFVTIRDMVLDGRYGNGGTSSATSHGIKVVYPIKDLHLEHLFILSFSGYGTYLAGGWGYIAQDVVIEFNRLGGWYETNAPESALAGTSTGAFAVGDAVTQDTTGATGTVVVAATPNAGTLLYVWTASGTFNGSAVVRLNSNPSGVYFTPTSAVQGTDQGPKISGCKIVGNYAGNQVFLGPGIVYSMITNSEFDAIVAGQYGVVLNYAHGTNFTGNRFQAASTTASGYISVGGNGIGSSNVVIADNVFVLNSDIPAIYLWDLAVGGEIRGNVFKQAYSNPTVNPIQVQFRIRTTLGPAQNTFADTSGYDISGRYYSWTIPANYSEVTAPARWAAYNNAATSWVADNPLTLPTATVGMEREFFVQRAAYLKVAAQSADQIQIPGGSTLTAAGGYIHNQTVGDWVWIKCLKAGVWTVISYTGTGWSGA